MTQKLTLIKPLISRIPVLSSNRCGSFCCGGWRTRLHSLLTSHITKTNSRGPSPPPPYKPLWCFGYRYTVSEAQFAHQTGSHPQGVCTLVWMCTSGVDFSELRGFVWSQEQRVWCKCPHSLEVVQFLRNYIGLCHGRKQKSTWTAHDGATITSPTASGIQ